MKIYTKTGDSGQTGLFGGPRVFKDHLRVECYGTVDELNAALGVTRSVRLPKAVDEVVTRIQHELFALGAELASPDPHKTPIELLGAAAIEQLERDIDYFEAGLAPLREFILPAGTPAACQLHLARAVCRRAERCLVSLDHLPEEPLRAEPLVYLNRLGDLLFVLARTANAEAGQGDVPWIKPRS